MVKFIRDWVTDPRVRKLGPGLITGAADDDPSGIATYSQAGAQFGFGMLWTVVLTLPLMIGIQLVSARIGCISGKGLAATIRERFPRPVLYGVVGLLLIANTINIAADIAAMGQALRLVCGGPAQFYSVCFGLGCLVLQVFLRYQVYVRYLKWLTLALFSYVAVVFTVHVPWLVVVRSAFIPELTLNHDSIVMVVAVFGTTISPYLFFWQAAQEMENRRSVGGEGIDPTSPQAAVVARRQLRRIRWDTKIGMTFSNMIAFFVILSTAVTLHAAGITDIQTSTQAAEALRPLGGPVTFLLFSLGIIGTGLLAVPVLAGSAAYAVTESLNLQTGLDRKLYEAKEFYAIIALATVGGVGLNFTHLDPIRALVWSAVINGVIAVPIMVITMVIGADRAIMGSFAIRPPLRRLGWAATVVMGVTVIGMLVTI